MEAYTHGVDALMIFFRGLQAEELSRPRESLSGRDLRPRGKRVMRRCIESSFFSSLIFPQFSATPTRVGV